MDRIHRAPRLWANRELQRFGPLFAGDIVNVSAWRDEDKEGRRYRDYFPQGRSYTITNFDSSARGYQGWPGEIYLDLETELPHELRERFDVVFNHTTLEHIYDFRTAFSNLCLMSRDVIIVVVPFLQQMHGNYGDFWRFSPEAVCRLFAENSVEVAYLSFNNQRRTSVYVFAVGTKSGDRWRSAFPFCIDYKDPNAIGTVREPYAGCYALGGIDGVRKVHNLGRKLGKRLLGVARAGGWIRC